MERSVRLSDNTPPVCRLGLATRGNTHPSADDVLHALDRGVNYWNWCGHDDGMSEAVRQLGGLRPDVVLATQIASAGWTAESMQQELAVALATLQTDYLDVVTLYYVESRGEWDAINTAGGAMSALLDARENGQVRCIGLTTHQRPLAAEWAKTGLLDLLMVRYNAAHRGAETEVFPVTDAQSIPVVCFTGLRWGALLQPTDDDPAGFEPPDAPECYRFVLSHPSVAVALMAPDNREELQQNLTLLEDWRPVSDTRQSELRAFGDRVRRSAGPFP